MTTKCPDRASLWALMCQSVKQEEYTDLSVKRMLGCARVLIRLWLLGTSVSSFYHSFLIHSLTFLSPIALSLFQSITSLSLIYLSLNLIPNLSVPYLSITDFSSINTESLISLSLNVIPDLSVHQLNPWSLCLSTLNLSFFSPWSLNPSFDCPSSLSPLSPSP